MAVNSVQPVFTNSLFAKIVDLRQKLSDLPHKYRPIRANIGAMALF
jgi:hypothetical protein